MSAPQVRALGSVFEIGAHTLEHRVLTDAPEHEAKEEIAGSKRWVEDCTGAACPMFCAPKGKFTQRHLEVVRDAGYVALRNVELLSLDYPTRLRLSPGNDAGLLLMPTTAQTYPHGLGAYAKNAFKRGQLGHLWRYLLRCRGRDWPGVVKALLDVALRCGGVVHLWGHSWEIEAHGLWQRLEEVLRFLGQHVRQAPARTNGAICQMSAVESGPAVPMVAGQAGGTRP
jgi:hypothetical protein